MAKKATPMDPLDRFAEQAKADPRLAVQMLLWKGRFENPEMTVVVSEKDLTGFRESCDYLKVTPDVLIVRPQGRQPTAGAPAQGKRRAVAASSGEPPRPFVVVSLVNRGTTDAIKPIENNEEDAQRRDEATALRKVRDTAVSLASALLSDLQQNQFSSATIREAAQALQVLARAR